MGKQSLTLKCLIGFSLSKVSCEYSLFFLHFVGNEGLYSIGKDLRKGTLKSNQAESFMGHSRLGLSCEWPAKSNLSKTLQIPACASHVAYFAGWHSRASRKLVAKLSFSHNLHQTLTHNPYIKSHKNIGKWLNKITIKFDTELKSI